MPCSDAMITDVVSIRPDQTVSEALTLFDTHQIRAVPVVSEQNELVGLCTLHLILRDVLPVSVTMDDKELKKRSHMPHMPHVPHMDISLDHVSGMAPRVAKRLRIVLPHKIEDVMSRDFATVHPETPLREGLRLLVEYGSPVSVVKDDDSNALVGLISSQTAVKELLRIEKDLEQGKKVEE